MDQYTTIINATEDFLKTQISALQQAIENKDAMILSLQERSSEHSQRLQSRTSELQTMRDSMHEWTMNSLEHDSITESEAEEIAEICGFELTKEVEVEVTVTYSMTVNVGPNEDVESIVSDIDFDTIQYNDDNISYLSSNVDRVDF
jgi:hypothetical protein